ncbi:MAG: FimV/HubP family polar landmark protein [Thiogranum sp.]|nr:FimV/HubP family polar landmark protein [Thiogranum sp.]
MFRKSALAMAVLGVMASQQAAALGLGNIELRSALNQPLLAEVELVSVTPAELNELKITIASPQAFENAGIDRPLFLTRLNFALNENAAGKPVVQITSRDVVREPFLDFLLELSWSKGKLLREYTVLVDPPVMMPAAVPAPQVPAARVSEAASSATAISTTPRVQHTAQMPAAMTAPGEYQTKRNDTLWKVANAVRPDTAVSMEQTMLGLLRNNPDAFYDNNINNMKAGYILRVPNREDLTSISRAQALQETRRQYQAWRQAQEGIRVEQSADVSEASGDAAPAPTTAGAEAPAEVQLQLVAPDLSESGSGDGSAENAGDVDALQRDLMMANEALEAERRQGEEMSGRVTVLEEQVQNMQRLLQLKDDQLAQMQAEVASATGTPVVTDQLIEADTADVANAEETTAVDPPVGDVIESTEAVVAGTAMQDGMAEMAPQQQPVAAPEEEVQPVQDTAAVESGVRETGTLPDLVNQILAKPVWLGAGGVLVALLAFVGLRRKRTEEDGFEESILQASQGMQDAELDVAATTGRHASDSSETSLLSEFAVSDMGSIKQGGEADPLAEADVYLAYGRFQQAEDLISEALASTPDDEDLNLKLLEVFLAAKNQADFDAHAQTLLGRSAGAEDSFWEKVSEMGRELSPENPMYRDGAAAASAVQDETGFSAEPTDFDAPTEPESDSTPEARTDAEDMGLDFNIDLSYGALAGAEESEPDSLEFDSAETPADLHIDMDGVESEAAEKDNTLDFDLEGMDFGVTDEMESDGDGDGELTDLDEVSTKLDLARAYIDMGDPDGARSILDEVLEEGSDDQVNEAKGIMEQMT